MADRGGHPVEWLRGIALSLGGLAAQGVAGGAVRGATDELRSGMPADLDAQVRTLVQQGLTVLQSLVGEAARSNTSPLGVWARDLSEGAVRGALEEYRRLVPEMRVTTQELLGRVRLWLERSASEAEARTAESRAPGDRARILAASAIAGATEQLDAALPRLAVLAGEVAARVGRGLVRGTAEELGGQLRAAARSPLVRGVGAGAAILAVLLAVRRR